MPTIPTLPEGPRKKKKKIPRLLTRLPGPQSKGPKFENPNP
jgi:hypothetical protein